MKGIHSISPFERILYLKSLPGIGEMGSSQIVRLATEAKEVRFEPGEHLLVRGKPAKCFYTLASGSVELVRGDVAGVADSAPETIGFVEMLASDPGSTATARSEVVALRFEVGSVLEVLEEDFELLQNSIRSMARYQLRLLHRVVGGTRRASWKPLVAIPADRDLDLLERLIMIRQGDLFAAVGLEAAVMLATSMKQLRWPAGKAVWEPGDPSGSMYLIVDGIVDAYPEDADAFEAGPGYPLGNIESLAHQRRWYRAVPRTDTVVFHADHESFFDVMEDDFEFAELFLHAMARGILTAQDTLVGRGERLPTTDSQ